MVRYGAELFVPTQNFSNYFLHKKIYYYNEIDKMRQKKLSKLNFMYYKQNFHFFPCAQDKRITLVSSVIIINSSLFLLIKKGKKESKIHMHFRKLFYSYMNTLPFSRPLTLKREKLSY